MSTSANQQAWARLEALLGAMHAGDVITVDKAAAETGIGVESAAIVLNSLVRADLFEQRGDHFLRVNMH